ncbi:MAG: YdcF family protein [Anaerolineae bacterium]|nr:YdcF family protein [Anaerolineae bacterium]
MKKTAQEGKTPGGCCAPLSGFFALTGCFAVPLLILVLIIIAEFFLTALGGLIIIADPKHEADAIVVLSGGGTPRLQEAVKLRDEKLAVPIILTETGIITENYGSLSQIEKNQLVEMGVDPRDIYITEQHVDSTRDEAHAIYKLMNNQGFKSVIVVTDPYHSLRTRMVFADEFRGQDLTAYIRPVRDSWYNAATWWTSARGWQATLNEYGKLLAYVFFQRYKIF